MSEESKNKTVVIGIVACVIFLLAVSFLSANSNLATSIWSSYGAVTNLDMSGYNMTNVTNVNASGQVCDGNGCIGDVATEAQNLNTMTFDIQPSLYDEVIMNVSKYSEENYTVRVIGGTHYVFGEEIL